MKRRRYTGEQIIPILKEHEAVMPAQKIIRKHGIANGTFYCGKEKFAGMEVSEAKRLRGPAHRHVDLRTASDAPSR